jgi:NitT/TauT family transport system permease protein
MKTKRKKKERNPINLIAPLVLLVVLYGLLELIIPLAGINRIVLPTPTAILSVTAKAFVEDLYPHFFYNFKVIFLGFLIAVPLGMFLAAISSQFNIIVKAVSPLIILLVVTPMITLIPLMQLWLGSNPNIRILVVVIQCTPIIMLNTLTGFTMVEQSKLELARSMGATKFQTFIKIIFPNAMPQVFTGIKLGCIFSTIGSITADFVYGMQGLGFKVQQATKYVMTEVVYGSIILIAIIGFVLYKIVAIIEKKVIVWKK